MNDTDQGSDDNSLEVFKPIPRPYVSAKNIMIVKSLCDIMDFCLHTVDSDPFQLCSLASCMLRIVRLRSDIRSTCYSVRRAGIRSLEQLAADLAIDSEPWIQPHSKPARTKLVSDFIRSFECSIDKENYEAKKRSAKLNRILCGRSKHKAKKRSAFEFCKPPRRVSGTQQQAAAKRKISKIA